LNCGSNYQRNNLVSGIKKQANQHQALLEFFPRAVLYDYHDTRSATAALTKLHATTKLVVLSTDERRPPMVIKDMSVARVCRPNSNAFCIEGVYKPISELKAAAAPFVPSAVRARMAAAATVSATAVVAPNSEMNQKSAEPSKDGTATHSARGGGGSNNRLRSMCCR
jgi:hypothetical protein